MMNHQNSFYTDYQTVDFVDEKLIEIEESTGYDLEISFSHFRKIDLDVHLDLNKQRNAFTSDLGIHDEAKFWPVTLLKELEIFRTYRNGILASLNSKWFKAFPMKENFYFFISEHGQIPALALEIKNGNSVELFKEPQKIINKNNEFLVNIRNLMINSHFEFGISLLKKWMISIPEYQKYLKIHESVSKPFEVKKIEEQIRATLDSYFENFDTIAHRSGAVYIEWGGGQSEIDAIGGLFGIEEALGSKQDTDSEDKDQDDLV